MAFHSSSVLLSGNDILSSALDVLKRDPRTELRDTDFSTAGDGARGRQAQRRVWIDREGQKGKGWAAARNKAGA